MANHAVRQRSMVGWHRYCRLGARGYANELPAEVELHKPLAGLPSGVFSQFYSLTPW